MKNTWGVAPGCDEDAPMALKHLTGALRHHTGLLLPTGLLSAGLFTVITV